MNVRKFVVITSVLTFFACLLTVVVFTAPIHTAIFHIVLPDGSVSTVERQTLDQNVVRYFLNGNQAQLSSLSFVEQQHLQDVRVRFVAIALASLAGIGFLLWAKPTVREWRQASAVAVTIILVTSILFEPLFLFLHELLFPDGNWYLPPDQYVLTQVYPLGFFVACWLIVSLGSWGLLFALGRQKTA